MVKLFLFFLYTLFFIFNLNAQHYIEGSPKIKVSDKSVFYPDFKELVKVLSKSVVIISAKTETNYDEEYYGIDRLYPDNSENSSQMGSGVIISKDGYIVTNQHVVDSATNIKVKLNVEGREYDAVLIGEDVKTDLALLKIESENLVPAFFGNSDEIEVGQWAIAIGNQFQLGQTVTAGIISAKSRKLASKKNSPYDRYIQTDASINPGSSGGPLFNSQGQVIGINTAIFSPGSKSSTGFNIGIGFATPINLTKKIIKHLKEHGKVSRGVLGVLIQKVTPELSECLNLEKPMGALIAEILPGSSAFDAKLKIKDVIVSINDIPVLKHDELKYIVSDREVGEKIKIGIIREGNPLFINTILKDSESLVFPDTVGLDEIEPNLIGITVSDIDKKIKKSYYLEDRKGVLVTNVLPGSAASKSGIEKGDIILEISTFRIENEISLNNIITKLEKNRNYLVVTKKKDGNRVTTIKIEG